MYEKYTQQDLPSRGYRKLLGGGRTLSYKSIGEDIELQKVSYITKAHWGWEVALLSWSGKSILELETLRRWRGYLSRICSAHLWNFRYPTYRFE